MKRRQINIIVPNNASCSGCLVAWVPKRAGADVRADHVNLGGRNGERSDKKKMEAGCSQE